MGMTRDAKLSQFCKDTLEKNVNIQLYMKLNVNDKLPMMAKSQIDYFTCGYNTSSISESSNSKLKRYLPQHQVTLKEIREHYSFAEHNSLYNKRYIKNCKHRKVQSSLVAEIMKTFNVGEKIADAIIGSIEKSEKLEFELTNLNTATVIEKKTYIAKGKTYDLTFNISDNHCSCLKQESAGLPCSHLIRYFRETGRDVK